MAITRDMTIAQVLKANPDAAKILASHGMHCIGCAVASGESVGAAAEVHGIDVEKLLAALNSNTAAN